jgi:hypothetical protein
MLNAQDTESSQRDFCKIVSRDEFLILQERLGVTFD